MNIDELKIILEKHRKWINGEIGGEQADLSEADLRGANLRRADLGEADLSGAYLSGAYLSEADLRGANLRRADLGEADLSGAYLSGAYLSGAYLSGADLRRAYLGEADLRGANLRGATITDEELAKYVPICCPTEGSFTAFKKAGNKIVKLEIPADALRSSATSRKCRASKAKVLAIENIDGSDSGFTKIASSMDKHFIYRVGETVEVEDFDPDRKNECSTGIHFFITRQEAVDYIL